MTPFCQSKTEFYNASLQLTAVQLFFCLPKTRQNLAPKSGKSSSFNLHIFKQQTFQQPLVAKTSLTKKFATFSPLSFNFLNLPVDGSGCFKTGRFWYTLLDMWFKETNKQDLFLKRFQWFPISKIGFYKAWDFQNMDFIIPVFHKYIQRPNILNQSRFVIHLCISLLPLNFYYEHCGLHYMTPTQTSCTIFQRKSFKQIPYISSINFDFARQKRVLTSQI